MSVYSKIINISFDDSLTSLSVKKKEPFLVVRRGKKSQGSLQISTSPPPKLQLRGAAKEKQHHLDIITARSKSTGIKSTSSYTYFIIGFR
jgi:hypothetical protein